MTEHPESIISILELAEADAPVAGVPPEFQNELTYGTSKSMVQTIPAVHIGWTPFKTIQKKAHELRPGDVIQLQPGDENGFKVGTVYPSPWNPFMVAIEGSGQPHQWRHDSKVTVLDGPPRQRIYSEPKLALMPEGMAVLARHRMKLKTKSGMESGKPPSGAAKRTGRPRKGESDKERLVISALATHHQYRGGSVGNYTPATTRHLAELASGKHVKVSPATVSRFFQKKFPGRGYKGYEAACNQDARGRIGMLLAWWQGDAPEHLADLRSEEYGRGEDD